MVYSNTHNIMNKIAKPTSSINLNPLMSHLSNNVQNDKYVYTDMTNIRDTKHDEHELSMWEFMRLYRIGNISVIDFVIVYIILYVFNHYYLHYDFKIILIATIPITILFYYLISINNKPIK